MMGNLKKLPATHVPWSYLQQNPMNPQEPEGITETPETENAVIHPMNQSSSNRRIPKLPKQAIDNKDNL
jgi:hypothetical protein